MGKKYIIIGIFVIIMVVVLIFKFKFTKKYHINEKATIDNYQLVLKKATYNYETSTLEAVFQITNLNNYSITINDREHFMLDGLGETQISNSFHSNLNLIKAKETVMYTLNYSTNKNKNYTISFNSGIKNHSAKFVVDLK